MKVSLELPDIKEVIEAAVERALIDKQSQLLGWKYFTLKETAELLQIKTTTLLDKRMPYINEIEYARSGNIIWFLKSSVEKFIANRHIKKYKR